MAKELIISANVHEKKVAILEDGVVTEFYVERRDENQGVVGNLYKGRVMKVLPGMQSAFVDIALERDAFLYVSDFAEFMEEEDEIDFKEMGDERGQRPGDRQQHGPQRRPEAVAAAPQRGPEPVVDEEAAGVARVAFEDVVEQLAEIADERVIPPPARDEELEDLGGGGAAPAPVIAEAEVTPVDVPFIERVTDEPAPSEVRDFAVVSISEEAEAEEESRGRGRSRRKPAAAETRKSGRGKKKSEARDVGAAGRSKRGTARKRGGKSAVEEESADVTAVGAAPSQFERITDEGEGEEGDLLKDAMVQEKIIDQVHRAEYQTTAFGSEPEPEWRIGGFRTGGESDFQRIEDEGEDASRGDRNEGRAASARSLDDEENAAAPFRHISELIPVVLRSELEGADEAAPERSYAAHTSAGEDRSTDYEEDREAEIRDRGDRAEFAVRRGGRGRRRRRREPPPQEAEGAAPATPVEEEQPAAAVAAPAEAADAPAAEAPAAEAQGAEEPQREGSGRPPAQRFERRPRDGRRPLAQRRPDPQRKPEPQRRPDLPPGRRSERAAPTISELLHEGQEILVQIAKEPIAKKGARITSHIALPGRLLVYMPTVNHIGVSRKIPSDLERVRLKRTVTALRDREAAAGGFIARTACAGHSEQELHDDMKYLIRTWSDVRKKAERAKAPALVHRDLDLVQRILRDQLSDEFAAIRVDNEIEYARIVEFVNRVQPRLVKRVKLYTGTPPILEKFAVQAEIDKAVKPRVWLRSGGYIVINQTEALVAIDVNTGKFVGKSDRLEDTITRTNLEAAKEIVRQVRLRDLGGIIVIDFIDMEERKNRQRVMQALQQELGNDRAPSKILSINDFGLVAITRKRVKQSLERTMCAPCPYCQGAGMVKSAQTMCFEILEQAKAIAKQVSTNNDVMLRVSPNVAEAFRSTEKEVLDEIEGYFGIPVTIEADLNLHQEQYDFAIV